MTKRRVAALCGTWRSPITAGLVAGQSVRLSEVRMDGDAIYWVEGRPTEGGRNALVCWRDGLAVDVLPPAFSVRTRIHEYGGGAFLVHEGAIYFSNDKDQRLYRARAGAAPHPITPESAAKLRYADATMDVRRRRLICVREDHRPGAPPVNALVSVRCDGDPEGGTVLWAGHDFCASPRLSPDGTQLAWLAWDHPNMPWDGTMLWLADVAEDGSLTNPRHIAGGRDESIFQPEWSPDGRLHFVSDRSGWWNLYCWQAGDSHALRPMPAEFGDPQWVLGMRTYAFVGPSLILCRYTQQGSDALALLDSAWRVIPSPYTAISSVNASQGYAAFIATSPTQPPSVVRLNLATGGFTLLRQASDLPIDPDYISIAAPISFPSAEGEQAYAFFYAPTHLDTTVPDDERPPLLVLCHGGPTGATHCGLNLKVQFWTSRGIAVLDVNYAGSSGYGRAYRRRLNGRWGIADVDDCVGGARYAVAQGWADPQRLMIAGGSAGGYTALCALAFRDVFNAGASYYGVSDLESLAQETHKFESHYLDGLIGPYPACKEQYRARSPRYFADRIRAPVIFFQGLDDPVVPPAQSEAMFRALRDRGVPTAYLAFEGEQHGFRKSEHIQRALEAELYFYGRVFGFQPADQVAAVKIENLDEAAPC
jgi:dipeptidyl aminopeptidase/acylaminoacyl peptidase